jgi:prevent-host-death family protein
MERTVGIRELKNRTSGIIDLAESGEAITVTRRGKPVARIVAAGMPPGLARMVAAGEVRAGREGRDLPVPVKPRGAGKTAADYVSEGRR